ncbi:GNAT family N-acetyltransferase [Brevibacterium sp. UCMA 11754]|nr:GNAT family N-acetyltransferase [Brevibacterium sp. UCMA 11754]MCF2574560.1 GNAT family N-acetyltransferase [Brevibacterium sp. UCMA 11754]MCF2574567.1 GNAT family N-acetyltransferase [Brevibacterium sp. UCMA 11754]
MNEAVTLRPLCVGDAAEMAVVLSHPDLYRYTGGQPPSEADLKRLYGIQTRGGPADRTEVWLNDIVTLGDDQQAVGFVQATLPADQRSAEISWVIGRPWQGLGYAGRAALHLTNRLRTRGVEQVIAHIHPDHEASSRIAKQLGMKPSEVVIDGGDTVDRAPRMK